ncbi:fumarylacetoacetate hydrolase family protein [Humibacter sp.]|uniref:fumarylacetoacetate hydrolase family protein n=1 Tax=Humibacter sp. TaxID=1940291 RepID=UPI002BE24D65|nr:fumarylacetoacetate hydrolase family protein [Humibacter sp.]HVX06375.1 fumarylacetoacetate hydrolase family protein [Humibacter sp.]
MRFAHLGRPGDLSARLAVVVDDKAAFADDLVDEAPRDLQALIECGDGMVSRLDSASEQALGNGEIWHPLVELRHASAVLRPPVVLAIGANYAAHSAELALKVEKAATVFSLWPNSLAAHGGTTSWPAELSDEVDYEAELGVIIGRPARDVKVADALDYVFGYTVVNDITARNLQFSEAQWSRCKSFDGFTPTGPVVVTADQIPDPQDLWLATTVDGKLLQDASTSGMVRSVAELISFLSRSATLQPGTLISTGSPGGAGYSRTPPVFLRDGSTVTVSCSGIGALTTHCRVL